MRILVVVDVNHICLQELRSFHIILIIYYDYGNSTSYILRYRRFSKRHAWFQYKNVRESPRLRSSINAHNQTIIYQTEIVKYLGLHFDCGLNWKEHIARKRKSAITQSHIKTQTNKRKIHTRLRTMEKETRLTTSILTTLELVQLQAKWYYQKNAKQSIYTQTKLYTNCRQKTCSGLTHAGRADAHSTPNQNPYPYVQKIHLE